MNNELETNSSEDKTQALLRRDSKGRTASFTGKKAELDNSNYPISYASKHSSSTEKRSSRSSNHSDTDNSSEFSDSSAEFTSTFSGQSDLQSPSSKAGKKGLIKRTGWTKFCLHFKLLLMKNYWIFRRNLKTTFIQLLSPVMFCLLIVFFQSTLMKWSSKAITDPVQQSLQQIPHCYGLPDCITIGYSIIGDSQDPLQYPWINEIMRDVAEDNSLIFKKDVQVLSAGPVNRFYSYLKHNPNSTWYGVVWCTSEWEISPDYSIPCQYEVNTGKDMIFYALFYNYSLADNGFLQTGNIPSPTDPLLLNLKQSVDNGILKYLSKKQSQNVQKSDIPNIEITYSSFPLPPDRFVKDINIVSQLGGYFFCLGPLFTFTIMLAEITREKELKLRQGLSVVGVNHSVFWLSWFVVGVIFIGLTSLILCISGMACKFDIFLNVPFGVMFIMFFTFGLGMVVLAFFISTLVSTQAQAQSISYTIILMAIVFELIFSQKDLVDLIFYTENTMDTFGITILRAIMNLIPSFTFCIMYNGITVVASTHIDPIGMGWAHGSEYYWSDIFHSYRAQNAQGLYYEIPSPFHQFGIMIFVIIIYGLLTWYFDHVISSNRGVADPSYFLFTKKYWSSWSKKEQKQVFSQGQSLKKKVKKVSKKDLGLDTKYKDSVRKEKQRVLEYEKNKVVCEGLRIEGLQKTYNKLPFGWKSEKDVHALRGVYLEVPDKELLCLLGHNGAGKSTLFGVLTGTLNATEGTAKIFGYDIRTDQEEIRYLMGVVPQFDILWGELTAAEHMRMFCKIKGVPDDEIEEVLVQLLQDVGLQDVINARTFSYSGGMKRRLSVAISAIGDPRIIFMDEPTTGMDPVSRRDVWTLIQKLKRNKVMILTTHAMEEADVLSDRIAVIVDGKFKCVGTPLYLKNNFGDGYRISLVCEPGNEKRITELMDGVAPSNKLIDESGGSMVFTVPIVNIDEISPLFKLIEQDNGNIDLSKTHPSIIELRGLIKDCGISHATLEEVFMKVTGKKVAKTERQQNNRKRASPGVANTF